jgi:hypothetical protein
MRALSAIDFACNDPDNGSFSGRTGMAVYGDAEIESPDIYGGYKFTELDHGSIGFIRIHRRKFIYTDAREWVGNWCWNRYYLRRDEMKRLLLTLRDNGWRVTCGPSRFYDWFNGTSAQERVG